MAKWSFMGLYLILESMTIVSLHPASEMGTGTDLMAVGCYWNLADSLGSFMHV
jgi:hypothetical protein